jgi:hypothetical protein
LGNSLDYSFFSELGGRRFGGPLGICLLLFPNSEFSAQGEKQKDSKSPAIGTASEQRRQSLDQGPLSCPGKAMPLL